MSDVSGGLRYAGRLELRGLGALEKEERAQIEDWLRVNFCDDDSFSCTLSGLPDGGLLLEDPEETVGGAEEFGVHRLEDAAGTPAFFVALFEPLPQGFIFDRKQRREAAQVIEGRITDVAEGYQSAIQAICDLVPGLKPKASKPKPAKENRKADAMRLVEAGKAAIVRAGGPSNLSEWRARFPEPEALATITGIDEGMSKYRHSVGSTGHYYFERDLGIKLWDQPEDTFDWLCAARRFFPKSSSSFGRLVFLDVRPLSIFTQFEHMVLNVGPTTDLSPLASLTRLQSLYVSGGEESDWTWLKHLEGLVTLGFDAAGSSEDDDDEDSQKELDLSSAPGQAVRRDWLSLTKWRALADHLVECGDPLGEELQLRLANEPSLLPWFWARGTLMRDPSWN